MPRSSPDTRHRTGFSLIEVLVALALVGLVLGETARAFGTSILVDEAANGSDVAVALAEDRLDAAGVEGSLTPGTSEGIFGGRYRWRVTVAPYLDPDTADLPESGFRLYRVEAVVAWREDGRRRQTALAGLRLAHAGAP